VADEIRFCARCDIQVKPLAEAKRVVGTGPVDPTGGWVHIADSNANGTPRCNRRVLAESETYTVENRTVNALPNS
jgi:hypothetical protein